MVIPDILGYDISHISSPGHNMKQADGFFLYLFLKNRLFLEELSEKISAARVGMSQCHFVQMGRSIGADWWLCL